MNRYIKSLLGFDRANTSLVQPVQQSRFEGAQASDPVELCEESFAEPGASERKPTPPELATGIQPGLEKRSTQKHSVTQGPVNDEPPGDVSVLEREISDPEPTDVLRQSVTVTLAREAVENVDDDRPERRIDVQSSKVAVPASPAPDAPPPELAYRGGRAEEQPIQAQPPPTAREGTQDISITIGRVIVTAPRETTPARKPKRRPTGVTTLDEYLGHRRKDERR